MAKREKYGCLWDEELTDLDIELSMIRFGAEYLTKKGRSLFQHYRAAQSLLWPEDDHHRWSDLILKRFCENEITVLLGSSDSGKTWGMAKYILVDYWAFPEKTLWLVSTTEGRGSELRIWGCIKDLFNMARERWDTLAGNPIDYLKTITTEEVDEERREARSLRRGIIIVPCKTGGVISGLAPYIGIKSPRLRHAGDEVAAMSEAFLNAYANWFGKADFRGIMSGNFMEMDDPLGVASEPVDGWETFVDSGKTQEWKSRFYGAHVVALDGRDSPNMDTPPHPVTGKPKYSYLIGPKKLKGVAETHGTDSWEWYSQCIGKPVKGMDIWRVLTKEFCKNHHASEEVIWNGTPLTDIYSLDPAYGGGDRCVGRHLQMGLNLENIQILLAHPPEIIPIKIGTDKDAEVQIAHYIYQRLKALNIPARNCFYDSFGRGTLGFEFARFFGTDCPEPVDSSAQPTSRPVRFDLFVEENRGGKIIKRLKRCDEEYRKFITEMYFSAREAIGSEQVRGLDSETIREGASRKFTKVDNKKEVEPKDDYKERNHGRSPDFMDNFVIGVEGARRRGFKIVNLGKDVESKKPKSANDIADWLRKIESINRSKELQTV